MIVVYEKFINENGVEDERNVGDFDSLKEAQVFFSKHRDVRTSIANLSKTIKQRGTINKKYKIFKINF